jgi:hypothetical protein
LRLAGAVVLAFLFQWLSEKFLLVAVVLMPFSSQRQAEGLSHQPPEPPPLITKKEKLIVYFYTLDLVNFSNL